VHWVCKRFLGGVRRIGDLSASNDDGYKYCQLGVLKSEDKVFCLDTADFWGVPWDNKGAKSGFIGFLDKDHPEMRLDLVAEAKSGACSSVLRLSIKYDGGWADERQEALSKHVLIESVRRWRGAVLLVKPAMIIRWYREVLQLL
jgi:hypothetical protein